MVTLVAPQAGQGHIILPTQSIDNQPATLIMPGANNVSSQTHKLILPGEYSDNYNPVAILDDQGRPVSVPIAGKEHTHSPTENGPTPSPGRMYNRAGTMLAKGAKPISGMLVVRQFLNTDTPHPVTLKEFGTWWMALDKTEQNEFARDAATLTNWKPDGDGRYVKVS